MWLFHILKKNQTPIKWLGKHIYNIITPQILSFAAVLKCCASSLTALSGQDERVYDQTALPAAHPHPARPRHPQTAVVDPQDRSLPSAALAPQMPKGNDPVGTLCLKSISCQSSELVRKSRVLPQERLISRRTYNIYHPALLPLSYIKKIWLLGS